MGKNIKHILAVLAGLVCLIVYSATLNPSVTFMDSGELGGALYTFGIPHPTGYPLYLVIGYIVSHIPLGGSVIYKLNFLSAVLSAAAVSVFCYAVNNFLIIINAGRVSKNKKDKKTEPAKMNQNDLLIFSFFASLILGFSGTFWYNALSVEVYPLHELFVCLIILLSLKIYQNLKNPVKKYWILLFLILGLSFANHMTTVLVIPGVLYIVYLQTRSLPHYKKAIIPLSLYIIPGILLYIILIVRAASGPYFNWSDPENIPNLLHHITGGDYSQQMFSSGSTFSNNLKLFGSGFFSEFAVISSIAGLFGVIFIFKTNKELFTFIVILMISCLMYALNYNIRDIQVYFISFYILFGICAGAGLYFIVNSLAGRLKLKSKPAIIIIAGVCLSVFGFYYNYSENNSRNDYAVEDLTLNTINNLEQNAVYLSYDWGYTYPAALYYQQAEGKRQDLKIFNIKFLSVPWYLEVIKKYHPAVYQNCSKEIDDYIRSFGGDEKSRVMSLNSLVKAFITRNFAVFPVYVTIDLMINKELKPVLSEYNAKPCGLFFKLTAKNEAYDSTAGAPSLNNTFRQFINIDSKEMKKAITSVEGMYYETAYYHYRNNNSELALKFLDKSLSFDKFFPDAVNLKNKILSEHK